MTVEAVVQSQDTLGEGPVWHPQEKRLYWVDIYGNRFHRYHPETDTHETTTLDRPVCVVAFRESGGLLLAVADGFAYWDGETLDYITHIEADKESSRLNDGAVDPRGCFWAGTMSPPHPSSALYCLAPDGRVAEREIRLTISNGVGWSPDQRTMYLTDSPIATIYAYDFDPNTSEITNRRVLIQEPDEIGLPDGLTVDSEGYIWSARWGAGHVIRYRPDGTRERVLDVPVKYPSSCALGGDDLRDLYITSAKTEYNKDSDPAPPEAGNLYRTRVETPGLPESFFKG